MRNAHETSISRSFWEYVRIPRSVELGRRPGLERAGACRTDCVLAELNARLTCRGEPRAPAQPPPAPAASLQPTSPSSNRPLPNTPRRDRTIRRRRSLKNATKSRRFRLAARLPLSRCGGREVDRPIDADVQRRRTLRRAGTVAAVARPAGGRAAAGCLASCVRRSAARACARRSPTRDRSRP